jgi:exportin-T
VWGGPDIASPVTNPTPPNPTLPNWDTWAMNRFTPLSWTLLLSPKFNAKDAQAKQVLSDIAAMQVEILKKTGRGYLEALKQQLEGLGVGGQTVEEYLRALTEKDGKGFRNFFVQLFVQNMAA